MTQVVPSVDESWADVQGFDPASPPYSPEAMDSEHLLEASSPAPTSMGNVDPISSSTDFFLYETSLVSVDLGRRIWGLRQPVYGHNDVVQGAIKLHKKCTHVYQLEVSVEKDLLNTPTRTVANRSLLFVAPWKNPSDYI